MGMPNWLDHMKSQKANMEAVSQAESAVNLREFEKVFVIVINGDLFWRALRCKKMAYDIQSLLRNVAPDVKCEIKETAFYPEGNNDY
jgi:hypothetical protein